MIRGKNIKRLFINLVCLFFIFIISFLLVVKSNNEYINHEINIKVGSIVNEVLDKYPNLDEKDIIEILNSQSDGEIELFSKYGIDIKSDDVILNVDNKLHHFYQEIFLLFIIIFFLIIIFIVVYIKNENKKINNIVKLIDDINHKIYTIGILENDEDNLSNLRSEIYKTAMMLKTDALESKKIKNSVLKSVADISHQLKTPLASISIMLDNILEDDEMDKKVRRDLLKKSQNQITSLNDLIVNLLQVSRMDAGVINFKKENFRLSKLLDDVINLIEINLELKNMSVNLKCDKNIIINGDYKWECEALKNIIKNSIDASDENSKIDIIVKENNFYVSLKIIDYGIGMSQKDLKHIFERFYKVSEVSNSFGIGLNLAKMIIENDNGLIKVVSEKGKGTTFEIKYMK